MQVDVANVEGGSAAAEIEIPHADEFRAARSFHLRLYLLEVVVPMHKRLIVVAAQALDVDDAEFLIVGDVNNFAQRRKGASWEDVLARPRTRPAH